MSTNKRQHLVTQSLKIAAIRRNGIKVAIDKDDTGNESLHEEIRISLRGYWIDRSGRLHFLRSNSKPV